MADARTHRALFGLAFALATTLAGAAAADGPTEADRLFDEAAKLVTTGDYVDACPKLERSQALDPGLGTQFNLADCYEHVGRTASAYLLFREVAVAARAAGKAEREQSSRARADALEDKVARLVVHAPPITGLEVRVDGHAVTPDEKGLPVDPGPHTVEASAPKRDPWRSRVDVAAGAGSVVAEVPELAHAKPPAPTIVVRVDPSRGSTQRTIGWIVGGLGVAGVVVGSVAGIVSIDKHGKAKDACPDKTRCPDAASAALWTDATTAGNVSTVGFVVGGVGIAASAVLLLTAPKADKAEPPKTARLSGFAPWILPGSAGLALSGVTP